MQAVGITAALSRMPDWAAQFIITRAAELSNCSWAACVCVAGEEAARCLDRVLIRTLERPSLLHTLLSSERVAPVCGEEARVTREVNRQAPYQAKQAQVLFWFAGFGCFQALESFGSQSSNQLPFMTL